MQQREGGEAKIRGTRKWREGGGWGEREGMQKRGKRVVERRGDPPPPLRVTNRASGSAPPPRALPPAPARLSWHAFRRRVHPVVRPRRDAHAGGGSGAARERLSLGRRVAGKSWRGAGADEKIGTAERDGGAGRTWRAVRSAAAEAAVVDCRAPIARQCCSFWVWGHIRCLYPGEIHSDRVS